MSINPWYDRLLEIMKHDGSFHYEHESGGGATTGFPSVDMTMQMAALVELHDIAEYVKMIYHETRIRT